MKRFCILALAVCGLAACETGFELALPEYEPTLVLNGFLEAGVRPTFRLGRAYGLDEERPGGLPGGSVAVYEGDRLIEQLRRSTSGTTMLPSAPNETRDTSGTCLLPMPVGPPHTPRSVVSLHVGDSSPEHDAPPTEA